MTLAGFMARFFRFGHTLAAAASVAISERRSGVNAAALAYPPTLFASDLLAYFLGRPKLQG